MASHIKRLIALVERCGLIALVERCGLVARMRFSGEEQVAQIELYCLCDGHSTALIAGILTDGWVNTKTFKGLPDGIYGFRFTHDEITDERAAATRALFAKFEIGPAPKFGWACRRARAWVTQRWTRWRRNRFKTRSWERQKK